MTKKNNYYPLTRVWDEYVVDYVREPDRIRYEIKKGDKMPIIVVCDLNDNVKYVSKTTDSVDEDKSLYLSLKRFKGKIAWNRRFNSNIE